MTRSTRLLFGALACMALPWVAGAQNPQPAAPHEAHPDGGTAQRTESAAGADCPGRPDTGGDGRCQHEQQTVAESGHAAAAGGRSGHQRSGTIAIAGDHAGHSAPRHARRRPEDCAQVTLLPLAAERLAHLRHLRVGQFRKYRQAQHLFERRSPSHGSPTAQAPRVRDTPAAGAPGSGSGCRCRCPPRATAPAAPHAPSCGAHKGGTRGRRRHAAPAVSAMSHPAPHRTRRRSPAVARSAHRDGAASRAGSRPAFRRAGCSRRPHR